MASTVEEKPILRIIMILILIDLHEVTVSPMHDGQNPDC